MTFDDLTSIVVIISPTIFTSIAEDTIKNKINWSSTNILTKNIKFIAWLTIRVSSILLTHEITVTTTGFAGDIVVASLILIAVYKQFENRHNNKKDE